MKQGIKIKMIREPDDDGTQKNKMKQLLKLTILLTICSCSNQVRTDGGRELNGKIVDILYVESDKGAEKIRTKLIQEFGQPTSTAKNEMKWDLNPENKINNEPMTMIIHIDSTYRSEGEKLVFDFVGVDICLIDKNDNDLLINETIKKQGQRVFQNIFDGIE
jgi:hypothetical protein